MLQVFSPQDGKATTLVVTADTVLPETARWIDLFQPTEAEETLVERALGIDVPTREARIREAVRRLLERYATAAGLVHPISPHRLRHFLFTWLKTQGIDDALIQPYSGHASRQSLEIYSRLSLAEAQQTYDQTIPRFPV